jgi:hypothetical protein
MNRVHGGYKRGEEKEKHTPTTHKTEERKVATPQN